MRTGVEGEGLRGALPLVLLLEDTFLYTERFNFPYPPKSLVFQACNLVRFAPNSRIGLLWQQNHPLGAKKHQKVIRWTCRTRAHLLLNSIMASVRLVKLNLFLSHKNNYGSLISYYCLQPTCFCYLVGLDGRRNIKEVACWWSARDVVVLSGLWLAEETSKWSRLYRLHVQQSACWLAKEFFLKPLEICVLACLVKLMKP